MKYPKFINVDHFFEIHSGLTEMELLKQFSSNLKTIHSLTSIHYKDFNSLIREYLKAGVKIFGMEFGIVSRVSGDVYTVCDAISPDDVLEAGAVFELEGTYCREVIKTLSVIGLPHVGSIEEMKGHPVYENMKLESYISAPIFKDQELFGTLNFSSTRIREFGFSDYERELISMLSSSIGNYLCLIDKEERLENASKRIRKLTGYLGHDLRSPLGNIFNLAELIPECSKEESLVMIEDIKSISEKAMEIVETVLEAAIIGDGKISLDKKDYLLGNILMDAVGDFKSYSNDANLTLSKCIEDVKVFVDKERMYQVFSNLLSNSIKYSKESSTINISITSTDNGVLVNIKNTLKDSDHINNIGRQSEQRRSGFGLEIVREILELHSSELIIDTDKTTFSATFLLYS